MEDVLKSAVSSRFVLVQPTCLQFHILAISSAIVIRECWEWPKIDFYIPDSSTAFENHYWTGTRVLVYREGSRKNLDSLGLIIIRWVNEVQRLEARAQILLTPKDVFHCIFHSIFVVELLGTSKVPPITARAVIEIGLRLSKLTVVQLFSFVDPRPKLQMFANKLNQICKM